MSDPAKRLGPYQVEQLLATGGMAEIYLARALSGGPQVVVKVILRERAEDQKFIQMFLDEARLVAGLNHPNIARLLEVGKEGQVYFLAMEFVHGETVRAVLERSARNLQPIPLGVALGIAARVGQALHYAHERKALSGARLDIVHRDVTPANVMVGYDGVVKLLDFGIARAKGRAAETQSGTVKGKFAYMAPEQCQGKAVDRRADVFALGILIYELTTLRRAFRGENDYDTLQKIMTGDIAPPSQLVPGYPPALEAVVQRAMALDPGARFQTAVELVGALDELAGRFGGLATPPALAAFMAERFAATPEPAAATEEDDPSIVVESGTQADRRPTRPPAAVRTMPTPTPVRTEEERRALRSLPTSPLPAIRDGTPVPSVRNLPTTPVPVIAASVDDDEDLDPAATYRMPPAKAEATPAPTVPDRTPPPMMAERTPVPTGGERTPVPTGGEQTPVPTGGERTPVPTGGERTPVPTGEQTPPPAPVAAAAPVPVSASTPVRVAFRKSETAPPPATGWEAGEQPGADADAQFKKTMLGVGPERRRTPTQPPPSAPVLTPAPTRRPTPAALPVASGVVARGPRWALPVAVAAIVVVAAAIAALILLT